MFNVLNKHMSDGAIADKTEGIRFYLMKMYEHLF